MDPLPNTERFTGRADVYDRYRPGYPGQILRRLQAARGFSAAQVVADIGSGTGKLTEVFLGNGNTVYAVEPNGDMRARAEALLSARPGFRSLDGKAEKTGLGARSVDVVAAGQAFHWFDAGRCREEFRRILRPSGFVVLAWNVRDPSGSALLDGYDVFLRDFSVDYDSVNQRRLIEGDALRGFFTGGYDKDTFPNPRSLDFEAVWGGYRSTSYSLPEGHPRLAQAEQRLHELFDAHQVDGAVSMPLRTEVYHGTI